MPGIETLRLPAIRGREPSYRLACCTAAELVAEKAALMVTYGGDHTRLQDILDLWLLSTRAASDREMLPDVLAGVFEGRDALRMLHRRDGYWEKAFDPCRVAPDLQARWMAMVAAARPGMRPADLGATLGELGRFLTPVLRALRDGADVGRTRHAEDGWRSDQDRIPESRNSAEGGPAKINSGPEANSFFPDSGMTGMTTAVIHGTEHEASASRMQGDTPPRTQIAGF